MEKNVTGRKKGLLGSASSLKLKIINKLQPKKKKSKSFPLLQDFPGWALKYSYLHLDGKFSGYNEKLYFLFPARLTGLNLLSLCIFS